MKTPTSIKPEATLCERIDLRLSKSTTYRGGGQRKTAVLSSLTKQILNSTNTSMLIADLIKTYTQKKTEHVEYFLLANDDSETHVGTNANLEHEVSKARCRVQCRRCLRSSRQGETYCGCDRMLQDLTDVVQKQAERRIRSRNIMYVPDIHDSALKNTHTLTAVTIIYST